VGTQRQFYARQQIPADRIRRLEEVGFEWDARAADWERMFAALAAFKQEHGDCRIPQTYKPNQSLAKWVNRQRNCYAQHKLPTDRIVRLEEVGFEWDPFESDWERMYIALEAYKQKNGDCRVPQKYRPNPQLGQWVSTNRKRRDSIPIERRQRLDALGFIWRIV
jgi:hypothetical protein